MLWIPHSCVNSSCFDVYLGGNRRENFGRSTKKTHLPVINISIGIVHLLATLLEPFMPSFSHKVNSSTSKLFCIISR